MTYVGERRRRVLAAAVVGVAGLAAGVAFRVVRSANRGGPGLSRARIGAFANGMEYATWGGGPESVPRDGSKAVLWLPGGPGSDIPRGALGRLAGRYHQPVLQTGYRVWHVTRRRHMPDGHTIADMADDVAELIADEFGGRVDAVVGVSYGGAIALYLAARHPDRVGRVVAALSAARFTDHGRDVDLRWARATAAGRSDEAGAVLSEFVSAGDGVGRSWARRLLGKLLGRASARLHVPANDLLVEAEAESVYDATAVLPQIRVPVLLIAAELDEVASLELVEQTARLIPDCTVIRYPGVGHVRAGMGGRIPADVAVFLGQGTATEPR